MKFHFAVCLMACLVLAACGENRDTSNNSPPAVAPSPVDSKPAADTSKAEAVTTVTATEENPPVAEEQMQTENSRTPITEPTNSVSQPSEPSETNNGAMSQGAALSLARKSGCLACHAVDKKVVGPPWSEVGKRYTGDTGAHDRLIAKIKKGGKGNWTDITGGTPMPPYSPRVSDEDISRLVEFVLSLGST